MNKNNPALIVVGFAALIIGVAVGFLIFKPKPVPADVGPAKYILMFGDPNGSTLVTANLSAFQSALASPAPNWSTLQEVPSAGATPTPVPTPTLSPAPSGTQLIARVQVIQKGPGNAPCTMHVTQKVGLNDPGQVQRVLTALNPNPTP